MESGSCKYLTSSDPDVTTKSFFQFLFMLAFPAEVKLDCPC